MMPRCPTSKTLTIGDLKQAFAGKPDDTPLFLYDDMLDTYFPVLRARAARVMPDANDFIINVPEGMPSTAGKAVVAFTA